MEEFDVNIQSNRTSGNNNVVQIKDGFIEEILFDNRTGYVTVSYGVLGDFNMIHMNLVVLIVSRDTIIQNQCGDTMSMRDLREGMIINAQISSAMTRSNPPQSRAFSITVHQGICSNVKIARVLSVDLRNSFLNTGNARDISSQMRFVITDSTLILDRRGHRICLRNIRPGQTVRVEHASFQTMSIPPQTTAFRVQVQ